MPKSALSFHPRAMASERSRLAAASGESLESGSQNAKVILEADRGMSVIVLVMAVH